MAQDEVLVTVKGRTPEKCLKCFIPVPAQIFAAPISNQLTAHSIHKGVWHFFPQTIAFARICSPLSSLVSMFYIDHPAVRNQVVMWRLGVKHLSLAPVPIPSNSVAISFVENVLLVHFTGPFSIAQHCYHNQWLFIVTPNCHSLEVTLWMCAFFLEVQTLFKKTVRKLVALLRLSAVQICTSFLTFFY